MSQRRHNSGIPVRHNALDDDNEIIAQARRCRTPAEVAALIDRMSRRVPNPNDPVHVVFRGDQTGIYWRWHEADRYTNGVSGNCHIKANSYAEGLREWFSHLGISDGSERHSSDCTPGRQPTAVPANGTPAGPQFNGSMPSTSTPTGGQSQGSSTGPPPSARPPASPSVPRPHGGGTARASASTQPPPPSSNASTRPTMHGQPRAPSSTVPPTPASRPGRAATRQAPPTPSPNSAQEPTSPSSARRTTPSAHPPPHTPHRYPSPVIRPPRDFYYTVIGCDGRGHWLDSAIALEHLSPVEGASIVVHLNHRNATNAVADDAARVPARDADPPPYTPRGTSVVAYYTVLGCDGRGYWTDPMTALEHLSPLDGARIVVHLDRQRASTAVVYDAAGFSPDEDFQQVWDMGYDSE